ncbi:unnamed protein product [Cylicocyclus nassatus]|uniref:BD-FAE-like domain-containing protein n=1 Tax=Cylicocyclus nassatus TaxID=53992 RepID=A0AA36MA12_CYLNA|nr:unnamed protein product [Cylicocyclus nassatus]
MDSNPELTHLYSCSRWAGTDPSQVINDYVRIGIETCEELRKEAHIEDIPYKDDANDMTRIDVWGEVSSKLVIFIHGGYWQEGTRKLVTPAAVNLVKRGVAMAAIGFDYASRSHPLSEVVTQVTLGVEFLLREYPNVKEVTLAGHSAGAHLAFSVAVRLKSSRIRKLVLICGVYDLHELPLCEIGSVIGMTLDEASKNSCRAAQLVELGLHVQFLIALKDSPKLIEQNRVMVQEARELDLNLEAHEFPEHDHFSIIEALRFENEQLTHKFVDFISGGST